MTEHNTDFEYKFEEEIINLSTTTMVRLFDLHNDAVLLYLFYVKTAKIQKYNPVYANAKFCQKGLGWGSKRFKNAKKILKDEGLIDSIMRVDEGGKIVGHFVKIKYFQAHPTSGVADHRVVSSTGWSPPPGGSQQTNTINKNRNTNNKKSNTINENEKNTLSCSDEHDSEQDKSYSLLSEESIRLLSEWQEQKSLPQYRKVTQDTSVSIHDVNMAVKDALKLISEHELIQAIRNYGEVITHPEKYYFTYKWKFVPFLYRGKTAQGRRGQTGFWKFLDEANPLYTFLRDKTSKEVKGKHVDLYIYKYDKVFDSTKGEYMGMDIDTLKSRDFKEYLWDLKQKHQGDRLEFRHFRWIEEGIIGSIYHNDTDMYKGYKRLHNIYEVKFSEELERYKE